MNGLLWTFRDQIGRRELSKRQRNLRDDPTAVTLRDKLREVPRLIADREITENISFDAVLEFAKPFRDSLAHASPFAAPERFGGYDKLSYFCAIDPLIARRIATHVVSVIRQVHDVSKLPSPTWLEEVSAAIDTEQPSSLHARFFLASEP